MIPVVRASLPQVIDSTIRSEYVGCHTKGYYSFQRNLGPLEPSIDLIAGGAFARGLEVTRLAFYHEKLSLEDSLQKGILEAIAAYGDVTPPEHKSAKSVERVCTALVAYFQKYHPARDHIQPYFVAGKPAVEFTFSIPLPINHPESGEPFIYAGRFDLLGLYNGQLIGVDEKTTSQLGPTWSSKWRLRGQFTGYTWACLEYGLPVVGIVARGVSFLKGRKGATDPADFHGFEESLQLKSKFEIDAWYVQLLNDVKRMVEAWEKNWYDQDFSDTCADYSGCPFMSLCTTSDPEAWIPGKFATRSWNPLAKVPASQPVQKSETVEAPDELLALMNRRS